MKQQKASNAKRDGEHGPAKDGEHKRDKVEMSYRSASFTVEKGEGESEAVVRCSVSSEEPYYRHWMYDPATKEYVHGYEVLGHAPGEVDMSRCKDGLVIQDGHYGDQIGIIKNPGVKDAKFGGTVEWCCGQRAQEIKRDAQAGIRRNMSVGYFVQQYKVVGDKDGVPIYRAVKWTPYEGSFVNLPADTGVGVGRSLEENKPAATPAVEQTKGIQTMDPKDIAAGAPAENKGLTAEQVVECFRLANTAGVEHAEVKKLIESGKTFDAIRSELEDKIEVHVKALANKKPEMPAPGGHRAIFDAGDEKKIVRQYNLLNVIRALAKDGSPDVGYEREISDQIAKAKKCDARGFFIPESVLVRAITGKTNVSDHITGNGAATVETELLAEQYIDELVAQTVLGAAGVRTIGGLQGDIAIPKGTAVSFGWIAEKDDAPLNSPQFSQVEGEPHTAASRAILSRRLVMQSSLAVQNLVARLILEAIGRGVEAATFDGTGADNQPTGLSATEGINTVSMTAGEPTRANLIEFWEKVYTANAGGANMKYIGSPAVKALLCKTRDFLPFNNTGAKANSAVVGAVGGEFLCTRESKVEGYDFLMSGLCNSKKLYFGNWSEILVGFWSGIDMIVDPYTYSAKGAWQVTAFQDCDVIVRHPSAFSIGTALA